MEVPEAEQQGQKRASKKHPGMQEAVIIGAQETRHRFIGLQDKLFQQILI
jgi:hypothetical protein